MQSLPGTVKITVKTGFKRGKKLTRLPSAGILHRVGNGYSARENYNGWVTGAKRGKILTWLPSAESHHNRCEVRHFTKSKKTLKQQPSVGGYTLQYEWVAG